MISRLPGPLWRLLALVAAVLTVPLLPGGLPARPDLVLIVVVAAAVARGPVTGALTGLAGGWLLDLVPPGAGVLGATALVFAAAGAASGYAGRWRAASPLVPWLIVIGAAVLVQGVRGLIAAAGLGVAHPVDLGWSVAITALAAALLVPLLLAVESGLERRRWG